MSEEHTGKDARGIGWYPAAAAVLIVLFLIGGREVLTPVRAILWHLPALLWWVVVAAACLGQGALIYNAVFRDKSGISPGMTLAVMMGLGLGTLSLETLFLSALGFMSQAYLTALVLVILLISFLVCRKTVLDTLTFATQEALDQAREVKLPMTALLFVLVIVFPLVLVPNRAFDALSYHLEVPMRYLQAGGMVNIPENTYSYSPLLTQMLYGLALGLQGVDLAGLIYYLFFLLTLWTVWRGGAQLFTNTGAAWAAAFLALTPVFLMEVPQAGADWSAAFFTVTALMLLAGGGREPGRMILAGLLAGLAAGCRHQAIGYGIVLLLAAGLIYDLFQKRKGSIRAWSVFSGASLVTAGPWYIKNFLQTGDPIYPLFFSLLGRLDYGSGFVDGLVGARPVHLLWSWMLVPYQAVFEPLNLSMTASVGVLPLALIPLLPSLRRKDIRSGFLLLWVIMSFFAWHLTFRTFRYSMPIVVVIYLWLGAAMAFSSEGSGRAQKALKLTVCLALLVNMGVFVGLSDYVNRSVGAALGTKSPGRYLTNTYEVFPAIDFLNQLSPSPGKVLFLGEMRGFYSLFPREVPSHDASNRLLRMIREGRSSGEIRNSLYQAGFTHILINPAEYERMAYVNRNAPLWQLDPLQKKILGAFLRDHTDQVFTQNGVNVVRIRHE